ncbi:MAG: hypothetical protein ACHQ0J_12295 [Candidatus Dormibacterales bacterium]
MAKDALSRRPEVFAALALTALYVALIGGHSYSIDGVLMYRQALSIVHDASLRFAVPVHWGGDVFTTSRYGIGQSLLYLPGVALLAVLHVPVPVPGSNPYDWDLFYRDLVYTIGGAPVHILVTVATAYLVARFVKELGHGSKTALLALASYGIASPAIVYARGDFSQPLLGLCLMLALLAAQRYRVSGGNRSLVVAAAAMVFGVLTRPAEGSLLLPALLLMIAPDLRPARWRAATYKAVAIVVGSYGVAVALTLVVNWGRFGSPIETGYSGVINWGTPIWVGVPGVLLSPARGIVWQFPLILLAPLGVWRMLRSANSRVAIVMAALVLLLFLNTALWTPWWGGWSWGSRLFVPAWPVVAILAAIGSVSLSPSIRVWLTATLFVAGALWAVPGTVTDLLGGYASTYDGSAQSFALAGYPPIGAWQFLHHLRAVDLGDSSAVDILWVRIAHRTGNASLLVPVILLFSAATLAWMAVRAERPSATRPIASVLPAAQPGQAKG